MKPKHHNSARGNFLALHKRAPLDAISNITTRPPSRSGNHRGDEGGSATVLAPALHRHEQMIASRHHPSARWPPAVNSSDTQLSPSGLGPRTPARLANLPYAPTELAGRRELLLGPRSSRVRAQEPPRPQIAQKDRAAKASLLRQLRASGRPYLYDTGMRWYCPAWVTQRFDIMR